MGPRQMMSQLLIPFAFAGWLPGTGQDVIPEASVRHEEVESSSSIEFPDCRAALEHNRKWNSLRYRNLCSQPLDRKLDVLSRLLSALFPDRRLPPDVKSMQLDRLVQFSPELSHRLALAARASPRWNTRTGRVRASSGEGFGQANAFVSDLAGSTRLFGPVGEVLKDYGVTVGAVSVEKVLVGTPKDIPFSEKLLEQGAGPRDRLPFDAIPSLRLIRLDHR